MSHLYRGSGRGGQDGAQVRTHVVRVVLLAADDACNGGESRTRMQMPCVQGQLYHVI